ncbi:DNA-binding protein [Methylomicrobium sp. RS1]|uniref:DNA-binding protein n=1 Tax=Candidatus Methylomicrobium oryzae TaxID=2802053 RepID=UPI0019210ED9|nr:DNA-binding protein [Methylomicrobium sp. RS1]MBL1265800.1 DNA-binding protein [Methylomicrobium sp. RS1]
MAAPKLTEEEVHAACVDIVAQGERPTALTLLDKLGRGSLTTITKYLNTWQATDEAQALKSETLPAVVKVPAELSKEGEDLLKKMWNTAKGIADEELEIQREALKQAEQANQAKVEEAFKFSEAQNMKIERLEDDFNSIRKQFEAEYKAHKETRSQLADAEKINVGILKDNDRLQHDIAELKKQLAALEEANKAAAQEKQALQKQHDAAIKQKDAEIRSLDMQVHKLQTSLDAAASSNEQLKIDIKAKASDLSKRTVEIETLSVRYEAATAELKTAKAELKAAHKAASDAEKLVAKLEGQLEVYVGLEKKAKPEKDNE